MTGHVPRPTAELQTIAHELVTLSLVARHEQDTDAYRDVAARIAKADEDGDLPDLAWVLTGMIAGTWEAFSIVTGSGSPLEHWRRRQIAWAARHSEDGG